MNLDPSANLDPTSEDFDSLAWLYAMCEMTAEDCSARIARVIAEMESLQERVEHLSAPSLPPCTCADWRCAECGRDQACDDCLIAAIW
jgi:hypothetical protein